MHRVPGHQQRSLQKAGVWLLLELEIRCVQPSVAAVRPQALVVDDSQVALCRSVCLYTDLSNVPCA